MERIETNQITFGKETRKLIKSKLPNSIFFTAIGKDRIIKNSEGKTLATWQKRRNKNGLIHIF